MEFLDLKSFGRILHLGFDLIFAIFVASAPHKVHWCWQVDASLNQETSVHFNLLVDLLNSCATPVLHGKGGGL
jgi:hypothetical protein